jgi:hypothetical protein
LTATRPYSSSRVGGWGLGVNAEIERACFAAYQCKVASIGQGPSLPRIRKANEVWNHLQVESVRIDAVVPDSVVLHLVPAWDVDLQLELCIKGKQLVYAGQYLQYPVDGYREAK